MKKLLCVALTGTLLVGCSNAYLAESENDKTSVYYNYKDELPTENIDKTAVNGEFAINISDVEELKNFVSHVFVATVNSIDGCSTTVANGSFSPIPHSYGKVTVIENLKGEMNGSNVSFAKAGGTISIADYEKNAPKEMVENDDQHRKASGNEEIDKENTYTQFYYNNDIELEAGKTYVFFANYVPETDMYVVDGVQYGTREIVNESGISGFSTMPSEETLKIKDNDKNTFSSYEEFKQAYFS